MQNDKKTELLIDKALLGTFANYQQYDMFHNFDEMFKIFVNQIVETGNYDANDLLLYFSDNCKGVKIRNDLYKMIKNGQDLLLELYKWINNKLLSYDSDKLHFASLAYLGNYRKICQNKDITTKEIINKLGNQPQLFYSLNKNMDIILKDCFKCLESNYVISDKLKIEKFDFGKGYVFTNTITGSNDIINNYSAQIGSIVDLASDKGYKSKRSTQQDAIISIIRPDGNMLNVVADGVGGDLCGEEASSRFVKLIANWFIGLSSNYLNDTDLIIDLLIKKINYINNDLFYSQGSTTFVLALTNSDKTIIANVGDSTAYEYNKSNDALNELTVTDSHTRNMGYEEARRYELNNVITACVGMDLAVNTHINVIDNKGQKIILSSDGVTDLVSEETFKGYFKNDTKVDDIISDAVNYPSIVSRKRMDNTSAIIINLYKNNKKILENGNQYIIRKK